MIMKALKYLAMAAVIILGFTACEKKDEVKFNDAPYTDEEILKAVKFVGQGGFKQYGGRLKSTEEGVKLVTIEIGKKGTDDCAGKGFCHLWIGPWQVFDQVKVDSDKFIQMEYTGKSDLSDLESIKVYLAEKAQIDMSEVSFPVTEEIIIVNEMDVLNKVERVVLPQECKFNPNLGEYGGFELKVDKL